VDLADVRHRARLPNDVRSALPTEGFVNYAEAQAVLCALEALAADSALRTAGAGRAVGVIALYPSQAALIRLLLQQSPALAAADLEIAIDVPSGFRQRECWAVLVSLTRSHTHRAVSFGPGPDALALALTRARARLLLFGDPGTLTRRSQWENSLDHLDPVASARERTLVDRLVTCIQGNGPRPPAFRVREGSHA
jgi:superfamily I DNA and/or RNA helicase